MKLTCNKLGLIHDFYQNSSDTMIKKVDNALSDAADQDEVESVLLGILRYLESFRDNLKNDAAPTAQYSSSISRRRRGVIVDLAAHIQRVVDHIQDILDSRYP